MAQIEIITMTPAAGRFDKFPALRLRAVFDCRIDGRAVQNVRLVRDLSRRRTGVMLTRRHPVFDPGIFIGINKAARAAYRAMIEGTTADA